MARGYRDEDPCEPSAIESIKEAALAEAEDSKRKARKAIVLPERETAQQSAIRIAQDAVLILRRELAYRVELSAIHPGLIEMQDLVALLKLVRDLGSAAGGDDLPEQKVNYDRLTPAERVQLAALQLKVSYE